MEGMTLEIEFGEKQKPTGRKRKGSLGRATVYAKGC